MADERQSGAIGRLSRLVRTQDIVWILLFLVLGATSEFVDPYALAPLAALGVAQVLEPKIQALGSTRGRIAWIVLKLFLGYLVIGYTGSIESHFWLVLLLPVVTAGGTLGGLGQRVL